MSTTPSTPRYFLHPLHRDNEAVRLRLAELGLAPIAEAVGRMQADRTDLLCYAADLLVNAASLVPCDRDAARALARELGVLASSPAWLPLPTVSL